MYNQNAGLAHANGQLNDQQQIVGEHAHAHHSDPRCHLQTRSTDHFLASKPAAEDPLDLELLN